ncbi:MAG: outer membrane lipoprotein chaperone LolA [Candidatus Obscuribacterales bacterium]|nr:outer membrane lipoprotein chaperone LolA [Steroidobacteraceae bacterium]
MMRSFTRLFTWGAICLLLATAAFAAEKSSADAAFKRLDGFMRDLQSLQADFEQQLRDGQGRLIETSSGKLALHRPNRFRWDYLQPHVQTIVADGARLWLYDPDLEQVTVRPLGQTLAGTPAMLLSGDGDLRATFRVEKIERRSGVDWLTLLPKRSDTDFKRVRLALRGNRLEAMELADKLGQTTALSFTNVIRNPSIDAAHFAFTPPAGADVIGATADSKSGDSNSSPPSL